MIKFTALVGLQQLYTNEPKVTCIIRADGANKKEGRPTGHKTRRRRRRRRRRRGRRRKEEEDEEEEEEGEGEGEEEE